MAIFPLRVGLKRYASGSRARGWLMDGSSLCCILVSVQFLLAFLAVVVFVDPVTFFGSEEVDFCGLTGVFFTLDILPLVFLLFQNDSKVGDQSTEFVILYSLRIISVDFLLKHPLGCMPS